MAVLPMHYIGTDSILRKKARKVKDPTTPEMQRLVQDMIESMHHYRGIGIAANQLGVLHRVAIVQLPEEEPQALFNLQITRKDGERRVVEGCLSLPGYQGRITRAEKVWARAIDANGEPVRFKGATGLLAQALEHENDHLNGTLYIDYLESSDDLWQVEEGTEEDDEGETPEARADAQAAAAG